jgi:hypothetical protein
MMNISTHSVPVSRRKRPRALRIRTTLYDLIAAINAEVGADEEHLVVALMVQLVRARRLTYLGPLSPAPVGH